jgi:hypothetical protein
MQRSGALLFPEELHPITASSVRWSFVVGLALPKSQTGVFSLDADSHGMGWYHAIQMLEKKG